MIKNEEVMQKNEKAELLWFVFDCCMQMFDDENMDKGETELITMINQLASLNGITIEEMLEACGDEMRNTCFCERMEHIFGDYSVF